MADPTLFDTVDQALSDLECTDIQCWCFTRAAMARPLCECANCGVWRSLAAALDRAPSTETLDAYRNAPSGIGPLAADWKDKPHRLIYDLIGWLNRGQERG